MSSSNLGKKRVMIQQPRVPHFIRVIIQSDHLLQGKLAIPRKFMREYGSALSESVVLKVPSGMTWKVKLVKSGDEFLFGKGWDKFVQCIGIEHGYLIVFRYQGNCDFRVIIFDLSATEIAYPCNSVKNRGEDVKNKENARTAKNCSVPTRRFRSEKRMKINTDMDQKSPTAKEEDQEGEECMPREFRKRNGRTKVVERKKTLKRREKAVALTRARAALKSANHSFMVVMQPAYIQRCYLCIPSSFDKLPLGKRSVGATLSSSSGRTWHVVFCFRKRYTRITSGWNEFVQDNGLQVGDVCAFELIERGTEISFKVVFFRATGDARLS